MKKTFKEIIIFGFIFIISISFQKIIYPQSPAKTLKFPREGTQNVNFIDGPYLVYQDSVVKMLTSVKNNNQMELKVKLAKRSEVEKITVVKSGFLPRELEISIKQQIVSPVSVYPEPEQIFVLSDIEGNFNTFINLLQQHKVIDEHLNWKFGKGYLVIIGDVFDRGKHVTELLWLIYKLEELAIEQGGMVHFILGNHEIMNLKGDIRYVENKYRQFAELADSLENLNYAMLYSKNTELGHWLRSKNIIEKIGDKIFVHGGVSPELAKTGLSIDSINKYARAAIDKQKEKYTEYEKLIMGSFGPFWYRGYFESNKRYEKVSQQEMEKNLDQYGARFVIVGHTHVKKPELLYNGRICAIDVKPAKDQQAHYPALCAYGALLKDSQFFCADENGNLEEM